jgi:SAM-dependent methyltransferase
MKPLKKIIARIPGSHAAWALLRGMIERVRVTWEFFRFRARSRSERPDLVPRWSERLYCPGDRTAQTPFDRHHVYHTAWAVRQLMRHKPAEHVDIASSLYFVALGSAVVPMCHLDYRPPLLTLDNLECGAGDLMALPFASGTVASLSCMHVIEHIGLSRYGDPLDPLGDMKAARELARVLAPGGRFLFAAPVGRARACFNGHRIYSFEMVRRLFPELTLEEWALIPDDPLEGLVPNTAPELVNAQNYACGCFVFRKDA